MLRQPEEGAVQLHGDSNRPPREDGYQFPAALEILDELDMPMYVMDHESSALRRLWGNHAMCQVLGQTFEEFIESDLCAAQTLSSEAVDEEIFQQVQVCVREREREM